MKFKIQDRLYESASIQSLTLKMALQLEAESAELGRKIHLNDIDVMAQNLDALKTDKARSEHPDSPWVLAVVIWATRRQAGEQVSFSEAVDFPMSDLTFLKEPQDHRNPTKRPSPRVSGRGAKTAPVSAAQKASKKASTAA